MSDAAGEARMALLRDITHALDFAMHHANGISTGYGLAADDLAQFRETLEHAVDGLVSAQVKLVRPEVRDAKLKEKRDHDTAQKAEAAWHDGGYLGFRCEMLPRPGWKGNKRARAEAEALYKTEPDARGTT